MKLAHCGPGTTIQATLIPANGAKPGGKISWLIVLSICGWPVIGLSLVSLHERHDLMTPAFRKFSLALSTTCVFMAVSDPAHALRCGSRLVKEGMHESQVIEMCGEPVSRRHLGYVLRPYILKRPTGMLGIHSTRHVYSGFHEELQVTELTFNFGPRKLMRVLRFEGSELSSIRTAGYGYRE